MRVRIEDTFKELTGAETERGALAWFARRAHVVPYTVSRWVGGQVSPPGPAVGLLEELERQAERKRDLTRSTL